MQFLEGAPFRVPLKRYTEDGESIITYEDPGFSIFTKALSAEEENLLREVLSTIGQVDGLENFEWIDSLKKKLNLSENCQSPLIQFDRNPDLEGRDLLASLFQTVSNKSSIRIEYKPFDKERFEVTVSPYLLKQYNNRWFLIARSESGDIMNFALDRILGFSISSEEYIPCDMDFDDYFSDVVGVSVPRDAKVETILLWVDDKEYDYVKTKPIHWSQTPIKNDGEMRLKYPELRNGRFIRIKCADNMELRKVLLSNFDGLIVLEPLSLRNTMKDLLERMRNNYR